MAAQESHAHLFIDEDQELSQDNHPSTLVTTLKYLLIIALFIVPLLALLKPSFSHPPAAPALTPANGIRVQTTNFEALHKPACTGEFCVGF